MSRQTTPEVFKNGNAVVQDLAVTNGGFSVGNPGLAIDTNFDVQAVNAFDVVVGGVYATVAAGADFDTGTARTIAASLWGAALLSVTAAGVATLQWGTDDFATEQEAIDELDALTPTGTVVIGYVTVQAHASGFTAGTDALQGGTGGNPSPDTNYYNVFGWVS